MEYFIGEPWWDYVIVLTKTRFLPTAEQRTLFTNPTCIQESFTKVHINSTLIEECIEEKGGVKWDEINSKIKFQLQMMEENNDIFIPSFFLNDFAFTFEGNVESPRLATQPLFRGL